jgi:hypothetical protein
VPRVDVVALVDDLMDRSRLTQAGIGVRFARRAEDAAGADVVVVDLARHGDAIAALRAQSPTVRIVCFGPHVDEDASDRARREGADTVLARSRFFRDISAAVLGSV